MFNSLAYLILILSASLLPLLWNWGRNLEYEYSIAQNIIISLAVPFMASFVAKPPKELNPSKFLNTLIFIFILVPIFLIVPGTIMFLTDNCSCSQSGFYFWVLGNTYPIVIFQYGLMYLFAKYKSIGGKKTYYITLSSFYLFTIIFYSSMLWTNPQKRISTFFTGFMHGPIYDSLIAVDHGVFLYLAAFITLGIFLKLISHGRNWRIILKSSPLAVGFFALYFLALGFPSQTVGKTALISHFKHKMESPEFVLYYGETLLGESAPESNSQNDEISPALHRYAKRLSQDTRFHLGEIKETLKLSDVPQINIFLYSNDNNKKLLFGANDTDVTDVKWPSIHISRQGWPHPTLRHELVHAATSSIGYMGLGFHPNMSITEGLASALAPHFSMLDKHQGAAYLLSTMDESMIADMFSFNFWKYSSTKSYTLAKSFISYILETHSNVDSITELYSGKSMDDVYGKSKEKVIESWKQFLQSKYDKKKNELMSKEKFKIPGVLNDLCPHSKRDLLEKRDDNIYARLRQPISWSKDDYWDWRVTINDDNEYAKYRIKKTQIINNYKNSKLNLEKINEQIDVIKNMINSPTKSLVDIYYTLMLVDLFALTGNYEEHLEISNHLVELSKSNNLSKNILKDIYLRYHLTRFSKQTDRMAWTRYLLGISHDIPVAYHEGEPWEYTLLRIERNDNSLLKNQIQLSLLAGNLPFIENPGSEQLFLYYKLQLSEKLMNSGNPALASDILKSTILSAKEGDSHMDLIDMYYRWSQYYINNKIALK